MFEEATGKVSGDAGVKCGVGTLEDVEVVHSRGDRSDRGVKGDRGFENQFNLQIAKFNTVAKLTHRMYGTRSQAAGLEIFLKTRIVSAIAAHRRTIRASAPPIECAPKKTGDQIPFKRSWTMNNPIARFFSGE